MAYVTNERCFSKACESNEIAMVKEKLKLVDPSILEEWRTSKGGTCLHLAALAGDRDLYQELAAKLDLKKLIKRTDNQGNTALHLAVRKDREDVVKDLRDLMEQLVDLDASLCDRANKEGETPLKLAVSLELKEAIEFLITRTSNGQHYIAQLNPDFLGDLAAKLDMKVLINKTDNQGNTALHLAVRKDSRDLVEKLVELDANSCDCANNEGETPLKVAVSLGFKEAVEFLITRTSNALHCIVELNQVKLLEYLIKENKLDLSKLINQVYQPTTNAQHIQLIAGDTPLHIAVRNKYDHMVNLLLSVPTVNKDTYNSEWKTPLDIAREVTEYYESFRIIKRLKDGKPMKSKPFMYCVPQVSHEKYVSAMKMVNTAFGERRNSELVVAALLATMTFTAAITIPGGFRTDTNRRKELGSPILIHFTSFKLFLIFDCIAFFLALFVCIMWQMASELTVRDKMLFMTVNGFLVCCTFGFTAYGFIAALYKLLARQVTTFAWAVLLNLSFITLCGIFAFIHQSARLAVSRARFHRLCGVPRLWDDIVIWVWGILEHIGLLNLLRSWGDWMRSITWGGDWICEKYNNLLSAGNRRLIRL